MIKVSVKQAIHAIKIYGFSFQIENVSSTRVCINVLSSDGIVFMRSNYSSIGYIQRLLF